MTSSANDRLREAVLPGLSLGTLLLVASTVYAHVPYIEGKDYGINGSPFHVENPDQSKAFYGWLDRKGDVDTFTMTLEKPTRIFTHTLIPACEEYRTFSVTWAIIGPGLPSPEIVLPVKLAEGHGALLARERLAEGQPRKVSHERFSGRDYYPGPELVVQAGQAGVYTMIVWSEAGDSGDYVAVIGEAEEFGPADIVKSTINTPSIRKEAELHGPCTPLR